MSNFAILKLEYSACVEALNDALRTEDEKAFFAAVDHIVHMREPGMFGELRKLTGDLQKALERFSVESKLAARPKRRIARCRCAVESFATPLQRAAQSVTFRVTYSAHLRR